MTKKSSPNRRDITKEMESYNIRKEKKNSFKNENIGKYIDFFFLSFLNYI